MKFVVQGEIICKCAALTRCLISNLQVADLGCADCKLLCMLKFCGCIEVLAGVDICGSVMKEKM